MALNQIKSIAVKASIICSNNTPEHGYINFES